MQTLRDKYPLKRRKIFKKSLAPMIRNMIGCAILSGIYFWMVVSSSEVPVHFFTPEGALRVDNPLVYEWMFIVALVVVFPVLIEYAYFVTYHYDADDNNLVIRKGIITKKEATLPFSKITDVYVDRDIVDVLLALYDVHFSTPTVESGTFAHIDGVSKKTAMELKQFVLEKINEKTPDQVRR